MSHCLVISDLDGTLLGDPVALAAFREWRRCRGEQLLLAYSSGRSFDSILESIREHSLPDPVAIIGEVGTDIRLYPSGEPAPGWPIHPPHWSAARIAEALAEFPGLERQPEQFQSEFKISYYLHNADDEQLSAIQQRVNDAGQEAELVYSSSRDLDLLPKGVHKGSAADFLASRLGLARKQTIACGDSGNDAPMFRDGRRSVIVANALPELKSLQGPNVYHASRPFAAGVLEGLEYWLSRI